MTADAGLSERQQDILDFLEGFIAKNGYPPSVREIGEAVGLSSSSTVHSHLNTLENKGFIRRDPSSARALTITGQGGRRAGGRRPSEAEGHRADGQGASLDRLPRNVVELPVVGRVAAGAPILAEQNVEESFVLPTQVVGDTGSFLLTVKGESMIEAGILDGDYVVVKEQPTANNGEIVVALLDDEATVKTFYREPDRIRLQPENPNMAPIYTRDVTILGKVIALLRTL
ncbi:MAG: transcriptional repressor LexA [Coriobacteriales bacterium]|jgi:repressor LexA|nr:transcriptional repressor LexA [Coriobacteriales bacterium]